MNNSKNYREKFVKKFIARTVPRIKLLVNKQRSDPAYVDTEPIMVLGQVIAEIETSIDYLKLLPNIITSHSSYYEKKGYSRVQQHRKKIEGYFAEVYILKERVIKMLTLLKKDLLKKGLSKTSEEVLQIDSLKDDFIKSLQKGLEIRGEHTHQYAYQDKKLFRLELLDLSYYKMGYSSKNKKVLYEDLKFNLIQNRKDWKKIIEHDTKRLLQKLDNIYFEIDRHKLLDRI